VQPRKARRRRSSHERSHNRRRRRHVCLPWPLAARPGLHQRHAHPLRRVHRAVAAAAGAPMPVRMLARSYGAHALLHRTPRRCPAACSPAAP
jgi:hypothetical protein